MTFSVAFSPRTVAVCASLVVRESPADIAPMSFESNLRRLEEIVAQLESDRLDLNAALRLFEEGIELLRLASGELAETESKVKELVERADGVLELRDLRT
ncbi:MAG: exodeoxyribonuclease VII small subunit [Gemmatimonadota bacterium]|nr:exodeoxyribonuclease VII small subunit [Gemmatimonadota bacterium]